MTTDIVLVTSPMVFSKDNPGIGDEATNPPMGILYLASYLEQNGFSVKVYDPGAERLSVFDVLTKIKRDQPRVVGISAMTSGIRSAVELALSIRTRLDRKVVIGIGGPHINVDPTFIDRFPVFDFSVVGEGEITLSKILKRIKNGMKLRQKIFEGELIENLDEIPFPARHLINIYNYFPRERIGSLDKPTATIVGSRGCPYTCSFCSRNMKWRKMRFRSPENIIREMEQIGNDYNYNFSFVDDAITLNRKITLDFCHILCKRGHKFRWLGMTRADRLDEELVSKMKEAGCEELFLGVESGNSVVRNNVIKKNLSNEDIVKGIKLCQKHNIRVSIFLMLGFPTETKRQLEDTVNFGVKYKPDFIGVHLTLPLPGSEIFEAAKKEGKISLDIIDNYAQGRLGIGFANNWPVYVPDGMTKGYLFDARKRAYRKFYLRPSWLLKRMFSWIKDFNIFVHDVGLVKTGMYVLLHGHTANSVS